MKKAIPESYAKIVEILTDAFEVNQSVDFILSAHRNTPWRRAALMRYSLEICQDFGEVWLSEDEKACALILYPQLKKTTLKSILLDLKLILHAIGIFGIGKALRRESMIKLKRAKEHMCYLWFIGVDPRHQGKGLGSKLLLEVIAHAEAKGLPVYLETSMIDNIPWYKRFGFKLYDELSLNYKLYFFKRDGMDTFA